MKRTMLFPAALVLLAACSDRPIPAEPDLEPQFGAFASTSNVIIPINISVFVPCADGGAGEFVDLYGNLHLLFHITIDPAGGVNVKTHAQPQGISGTGLTTGDKYQGTGVTQDRFHTNVVDNFTFVNNFKIIGQGPGNNFLVHQNVHITVNANGDLTADVDNFSVRCT